MTELTPEQQEQVEQLFACALEAPPEERPALLDSRCSDPGVRGEVESLLAARPAADRVLRTPLADNGLVADALGALPWRPQGAPLLDQDPDRIGPYRILCKLGEGGMGTVYRGEQTEPLRRQVALKVLKLGMDTRSVLARFETERQALALMGHPNVARALDAGATDAGRPYFVMEYVAGKRITDYCDQHQLDIRARLELFVAVCAAIQHAHQKGIIHRDIKPSNVLVADENGAGAPKVIDFGVAKALHPRLTERSLHTEQGVLIGTPEYMSPEQADASAADVDTRTDIYSLGVLLYELVVGALPLDSSSVRQVGIGERQRVIREDELPKPSMRLSSLGAAANAAAARRRTDPSSLRRQLRGDLDWIVMKCLEKERERRYASAAELSDDVRCYLEHKPVAAGPPSAAYRARKFVRRHRTFVFSAAVVSLAVLAGSISTGLFAFRESRQRSIAEAQAEIAKTVNDFLNEMLASVDPRQAQGRDAGLLREILDQAAANVETGFRAQPQVESAIRRTIGQTYMNLGLLAEAEAHLKRSLEIERLLDPGPRADLAAVLHLLGAVRYHQGLYDESELLLSEAIELRRAELGAESELVAASLNQLAMLLLRIGRLDEAKTRLDEALAIVETTRDRDAASYLNITNTLAGYHGQRGEFAEAEAYVRDGLAAYADRPDHPDALVKLHNLATLLKQQGKFDEAEAVFREARERVTRVFGPQHQFTLEVSNALAANLERQGHLECVLKPLTPAAREGR